MSTSTSTSEFPITSEFINKNLKEERTQGYLHTAMVSHRGNPVSFAMRDDGKIFYSVLDMSNTERNANKAAIKGEDSNNDKHYWSHVNFTDQVGVLPFPQEIAQVGYGVVDNYKVAKHDSSNRPITNNSTPADPFYSSTARLGAKAPFQALSDGMYIYIFRQSVTKEDLNNLNAGSAAIVHNTLLVDRFILSGTTLKLSREVRYQRSRHRTEPESSRDTLAATDVEGNPFYEPTRELAFVNNLQGGMFSVLLLPGADSEEQRWQIFSYDTISEKMNSFNIRFDHSIVFDTSDAEALVGEFIERYELDENLIADVRSSVVAGTSDDGTIADTLLASSPYNTKGIPKDALAELVYTIRTGVTKDDFIPASPSRWPLIEYNSDGTTKVQYLENGVLKVEYTFQAGSNELQPGSENFMVKNGLSSCYYYQQEMGADNKPMKSKACVMLAMGLEDVNTNKYLGVLNFSVAASGRLGRLTTDTANLPDINVQALDENPYDTLQEITNPAGKLIGWQQPQKMGLMDIDPHGLSTSGGVLRFAYTSSEQASSEGYSDAVEATGPYVFDDSLGRVNLYFKGKKNNFFVLYFNPTGSRGNEVTDPQGQVTSPALSLEPRLDRDMDLRVKTTVPADKNTCTLTMNSGSDMVEEWKYLPKRLSQIADILNGKDTLPLGTLDPLEDAAPLRTAYTRPSSGDGTLTIRATVDSNLIWDDPTAHANQLSDGQVHQIATLAGLSSYLAHHKTLHIAGKKFSLVDTAVQVKADLFHRSYLSALVDDPGDIDKLWECLKNLDLVMEIDDTALFNATKTTTLAEGATLSASDTTLSIASADDLGVSKGAYLTIGNEILRIDEIHGNDLQVTRGQLGSVAASHNAGSQVIHNTCLVNGAFTANATQFTATSAVALGIAVDDHIKIGNEILLVKAVSGSDLTVQRGQENSTAVAHSNGSVVMIHSKGVTLKRGYLKAEALLETERSLLAAIANIPKVTTMAEGSSFSATDTTLSVASENDLNVPIGAYLTIDNEILKVDAKSGNDITVTRGQLGSIAIGHIAGAQVSYHRCLLNGALTAQATQLTVIAATDWGIALGDHIKIGDEKLKVTAVSGNDLTISRGERGSTAAAHANGSVVTKNVIITNSDIDSLGLQLLRVGNQADKNARRFRLIRSLMTLLRDAAKVRILTFTVQDANTESVDRLEAGLAVEVAYDYQHFECDPTKLSGISATAWTHPRSYLFDAQVAYDHATDATTEIDASFDYTYQINNTIGQWEDWEAGLALEFDPASATSGALLTNTDPEKLDRLQPTKKGLSVEAWVRPNGIHGTTGHILYYKNEDQHYSYSYSLGVEKVDTTKYKCVATLGDKQYTTSISYPFDTWKHLAFTHKKYWGYQLANGQTIDCGSDDSLHLNDEFTLEVLVKIDSASGTIIEKEGEYAIKVSNKSIQFMWVENGVERDLISGSSYKIDTGEFYKITVIRSRNKPQSAPSTTEYPITGNDQGSGSDDKWYKDKSTDEIIEGIAEKQDQMGSQMDFATTNMFGNTVDDQDGSPSYYHTLSVVDANGDRKEYWIPEGKRQVQAPQAFKKFSIGGGDFQGTFASVRIWDRALSKANAERMALPENKTGLLSHWRMAEGKGIYLYDEVGENHGLVSAGTSTDSTWTDSPRTDQLGQFQFYVDGTPVLHELSSEPYSADGENQLSIGGYETGSGTKDHFKGTLEEIRVWNLPRTHEQITDNAFGRLKGEREQLLANYTFDAQMKEDKTEQGDGTTTVKDASSTETHLTVKGNDATNLKEVLSTAPVATEIPQIRSALTGVLTDYNGTIASRPAVLEYGDVQQKDDGTLNGILKRCYSFIDANGTWHRMTGYKVGNLISQWYGQAQFAPQVMGYLEGPPPVPAENFPIGKDGDVDTYAYKLNNSISFDQAEEVSYNYSTSKEAGWNVTMEGETKFGLGVATLIAPFGIGLEFESEIGLAAKSNWETSGNRAESYERGVTANTGRNFSAALAGYDNGETGKDRYYKLGNTGYALVKSKTADVYLLRLAHNNALVSISWQPNPDIPEGVNILPFPINPLYTKQGTLDGKFGETTDPHYPQAQGAYGQYSYFKPREAYTLKKQVEREKAALHAYFEDSFDVGKTSAHFNDAVAATGVAQMLTALPVAGPMITSLFNQAAGQVFTQALGYNTTDLKEDLAKMGSQRNLVNTYVWTVEGGFYAESTEVAETQQETFAYDATLSLGGGMGQAFESGAPLLEFGYQSMFSSGSSLTMTKTKTKEANTSFGLDVSVDIPTSPRYQYTGVDGRSLAKGLIGPGTVDAYRFMSFYLEPKGQHFTDLFTEVIDPIWLAQSPDPNAQALRQARGNIDRAKPCWRILHRVTYVSRILPGFTPEAPPSLEKTMQISGYESNYMLIKRFEPYVANIHDPAQFFTKVEEVIDVQLPEFTSYKEEIKAYLALYFNIGME